MDLKEQKWRIIYRASCNKMPLTHSVTEHYLCKKEISVKTVNYFQTTKKELIKNALKLENLTVK